MRARPAPLVGVLLAAARSGCTAGGADGDETAAPPTATTPASTIAAPPSDGTQTAGYASAFLGAGGASGSDRHAVVRGEVRLVIPVLGYDGVATSLADDDSVAQGLSTCA